MLVGIGAVKPDPGCVHGKSARAGTVQQPSVQMLHRDGKRGWLGSPGALRRLDLVNSLVEFPDRIKSAAAKLLRLAVELDSPARMSARLGNIPAGGLRRYVVVVRRLRHLGEITIRVVPLASLKVRITQRENDVRIFQ